MAKPKSPSGAVEVVVSARDAASRADWEECAAICQVGIESGEELELDDWVAVRLGLASAAMNLEPVKGEIVEEAIAGTKAVVGRVGLSLVDPRRGEAFRYLGGLHDIRVKGRRYANLTNVADYYEKAAGVFRESDYPDDWALLRVGAAIAMRDRVRELGLSFVTSSELEREVTVESVRKAMRACEDALRVYSQSSHESERREVLEVRASLNEMLGAVQNS